MTVFSSDDGPVYLRLRAIIAGAILRGAYRAGDQLPSVRAFAAEHGANPLTVANGARGRSSSSALVVPRNRKPAIRSPGPQKAARTRSE
jgi:GntR family transcriptional regulator